jgi:hypothetical protein
MNRIILLIFMVLYGCLWSVAQNDTLPEASQIDSLMQDNNFQKFHEDKFADKIFGEYPNPRAALVLSLILPGAGQAYNKKYWKIPIVYGTMGYLLWRISDNRENYNQRKLAYEAAITGDTTIAVAPELQNLNASTLRLLRNNSKKQLESNWIFLVLTYLLNGVDAYVDAHLLEFDVSEDLTLQVDPSFYPSLQENGQLPMTGLSVRFAFR